MKTFSEREAQDDFERVLEAVQQERVLITRDGRPTAVVLGLESYDAETAARLGRVGLWSDSEPEAPWDFRARRARPGTSR